MSGSRGLQVQREPQTGAADLVNRTHRDNVVRIRDENLDDCGPLLTSTVYLVTSPLSFMRRVPFFAWFKNYSVKFDLVSGFNFTHWGLEVDGDYYDLKRNGAWPFAKSEFKKTERGQEKQGREIIDRIPLGCTHFSSDIIQEIGDHLIEHCRYYTVVLDNCQAFSINFLSPAVLCRRCGYGYDSSTPTDAYFTFLTVSILRRNLYISFTLGAILSILPSVLLSGMSLVAKSIIVLALIALYFVTVVRRNFLRPIEMSNNGEAYSGSIRFVEDIARSFATNPFSDDSPFKSCRTCNEYFEARKFSERICIMRTDRKNKAFRLPGIRILFWVLISAGPKSIAIILSILSSSPMQSTFYFFVFGLFTMNFAFSEDDVRSRRMYIDLLVMTQSKRFDENFTALILILQKALNGYCFQYDPMVHLLKKCGLVWDCRILDGVPFIEIFKKTEYIMNQEKWASGYFIIQPLVFYSMFFARNYYEALFAYGLGAGLYGSIIYRVRASLP